MQPKVQTKSMGMGRLFEILQKQLRIDKTDLEKVSGKETYTVSVCMQFKRVIAKQTQLNHTSQRIDFYIPVCWRV